MARRQGGPDPKEAALAGARCLNPHPEQVTDPEFLASDFFDTRDAVQVKYEMVRKVQAGGAPVTEAAAAFGYSRPAYYAAAAFPLGLGVLARGGVTAWQRALASLAVPQPPSGRPPGAAPAHLPALPAPVAAELISVLAAVTLAGTVTGPPP
jgi:hypothetical protein